MKNDQIPREVLIEVLVNFGIAGNELKILLAEMDNLINS